MAGVDLHVVELDWMDPAVVATAVRDLPWLCWFDSGGRADERGRYSYVCADPFRTLIFRPGEVEIDSVCRRASAFATLRSLMAEYRLPPGRGPVPFSGGAAGLLGYGLRREQERLPDRHDPIPGLPDGWIGFFDVVVGFDRRDNRCWILSSGFPETGAQGVRRARSRAAAWRARLAKQPPAASPQPVPALAWHHETSPQSHRRKIVRARDLIAAGDIFQANITVRAFAPRPPGLAGLDLFLSRREGAQEPFRAFLAGPSGSSLASLSPERFLRVQADRSVETRPIKGTRRRDPDPVADRHAANELALSAKDCAENLMIVDLMRNDLAKVCDPGSIEVPQLCEVESFAALHHLVSAVRGRLSSGEDAVSLLAATFPGGSVTGAPKLRAMEVIDELEDGARGAYCGCILWVGFDGQMDSSIVIRTLVVTEDRVWAQAGGGIVFDSDPDEEHAEMLAKITPLVGAGAGD
ncbi:anthranilate synthase component I family protein [Rhizosaccharibacter radicis]|uniref:Anthranilate synthase component I family protein n=1 Tax=Rhizosaccharibacter radicis TaxID=2782605 RepID=A0ABT1VWH3_9PROT|nr:anthranilate synthase component I family protein [Acetobacteraceae bacterium KSS12]